MQVSGIKLMLLTLSLVPFCVLAQKELARVYLPDHLIFKNFLAFWLTFFAPGQGWGSTTLSM